MNKSRDTTVMLAGHKEFSSGNTLPVQYRFTQLKLNYIESLGTKKSHLPLFCSNLIL